MVTSTLTSSPVMTSPAPLTSSTPDGVTRHTTGSTARHVDFVLDDSSEVTVGSDAASRRCKNVLLGFMHVTILTFLNYEQFLNVSFIINDDTS